MKAARFDYVKVSTCREAVQWLSREDGAVKAIAGGQSLGPMLNLRLVQPELLVDLTGIAELRAVVCEDDAVTLGACTPHADIEDLRVPDATCGLMPWVARNIAYRAVRNRGTLGGSLVHADPAADWVAVMALLDARYLVAGSRATRTIASAQWMAGAFTTVLADDELLTGVRIPLLSSSARWSYRKFNRKVGEFAEAIAAIVVDPVRDLCRAVIGATDGAPRIIDDASALLRSGGADAVEREIAGAGFAAGSYEHRVHAAMLLQVLADLRSLEKRAA